VEVSPPSFTEAVGWDSNMHSLDGFSPRWGWIKVDLKPLHTLHTTYRQKLSKINKLYSRNRARGRKLYKKYAGRWRNRVKNYLCRLAKHLATIFPAQHGFEKLEKQKMQKKRGRRWNRRLGEADWRFLVSLMRGWAPVVEVFPGYTSKTCSRCGEVNKALRSQRVLRCPHCGLEMDRQLNACINIYHRMRGVSPQKEFKSSVGGLPLMGAEQKDPYEPVRGPNDVVKPQVYICLPLTT